MKRSVINELLTHAKYLFAARQFHLPPFARWTPAHWRSAGPAADGIRRAHLGWDITDFGSNDFPRCGLLLFTLRNGDPQSPHLSYAEKIMISRPGQRVPFHFHWKKSEDIINRGASGWLIIEFHNATPDGQFAATPITLECDGITKTIPAGGSITLGPGESVRITPGIYHSFYARADSGPALIGEVSSLNDDATDNRFFDPLPRFSAIEEDALPLHLLCNEYPAA